MTDLEFLEKVKEFEGLRQKPYKCPSGVLTIGYGHTHGVVPGMLISPHQADLFLEYDLQLCVEQLYSLHSRLICGSGLYFALIDFVFNVGIGSYKKSSLRKVVDEIRDLNHLTELEKQRVSIHLMQWCYSRKKKLAGLEKRRSWECSLLYED